MSRHGSSVGFVFFFLLCHLVCFKDREEFLKHIQTWWCHFSRLVFLSGEAGKPGLVHLRLVVSAGLARGTLSNGRPQAPMCR